MNESVARLIANQWPLKLAQNLGRYDDLIFCPLDLPPPPEVDTGEFVDWMLRAGSANMAPKRVYEKLTGHEYPWAVAFPDGGSYKAMKDEFPQVTEYLASFPFDEIEHTVILAQRGCQHVFTHTDRDWLRGMRVYLKSKNKEGLHFFRGREKYDEFDMYKTLPDGTVQMIDWNESHHMDEPIYAEFPEGCQTFMLNSGRASHAIDTNTCELGERVAILVRGKYNEERFNELMERSLAKYGDKAIWY
jgi:hypothetical protein